MITSHTSYPKYKDSGVHWLGNIPADWDVLPFKKIFKSSDERVEDSPSLDMALSISGYRGVESRNIDSMEGQMPSENIEKYRIVRKGQLAVNTMWLNYAGLGVSDLEGYVSPAYRAYSIGSILNKRFAHHLLRSPRYVQKYSSMLYGLRPNSLQVKNDDFEKIEVLVPPLDTQKKIAAFLDEKTKVIDALVQKKEKLIELLREKRQSLITRVVTKGLDPKTKMKDSGVEWLGHVPESWIPKKVKYLISANDGGVWGETEDPEGIPVLRSTEISIDGFWRINDTELAWRSLTASEISKATLVEGDLLMTKSSGSEEHIGKTAVVNREVARGQYCYSNFMQRIRAREGINSKLLYYFFNSYISREQYKYFSTSTTGLGNLTATLIGNMIFIQIPESEQEEIVNYLDREDARIAKFLSFMEDQINKLKEYRSSLIYSAVTGKIQL